jgi:hypothetical protein
MQQATRRKAIPEKMRVPEQPHRRLNLTSEENPSKEIRKKQR